MYEAYSKRPKELVIQSWPLGSILRFSSAKFSFIFLNKFRYKNTWFFSVNINYDTYKSKMTYLEIMKRIKPKEKKNTFLYYGGVILWDVTEKVIFIVRDNGQMGFLLN